MRAKLAIMVATLFLLLGGLQSTGQAQHRGGERPGIRSGGNLHSGGNFYRGGGFYRGYRGGSRVIISPSFGWGWGGYPYYGWNSPWYSPWYGYGYGYPTTVQVEHINYGTVKFKVKPENTRVYIDDKLVGTVDDLHDEKAYVSGGNHDIRLVAPNGQTYERSVFVAVGEKITIDRKFGY